MTQIAADRIGPPHSAARRAPARCDQQIAEACCEVVQPATDVSDRFRRSGIKRPLPPAVISLQKAICLATG